MRAAPPAEVAQAGRLLFGRAAADPLFLLSLDSDSLKRRYHECARACHPDLASSLGRHATQLTVEFRRVARAYHCLQGFLRRRSGSGAAMRAQASVRPRPRPPGRRHSNAGDNQRSYRAHYQRDYQRDYQRGPRPNDRPAPERRLFLAEYLLYRGLITRAQMHAALAWQRRERPLIGRIAKEWGYLFEHDIRTVLRSARPDERFGECARRLGLISIFQHYALIGHQKRLELPVGRWFVQEGLLDQDTIEAMVEACREHNRRILLSGWKHAR